MALERGAGAKGDDRGVVLGAQGDDRGDLLGAAGEGDGVGGVRRVVGFVLAVLGADRCRGRQPIAEALLQRGEQRRVERRTL